jgi:L,D-transpeptidase catalytic domain
MVGAWQAPAGATRLQTEAKERWVGSIARNAIRGLIRAALAVAIGTTAAADANAYQRYVRPKPVERAATTAPARSAEGPLQIVVSIGSQRIFVYDKNGLVQTSIVSTGTGGFPTPMGVFAVLDKNVQHFSNIYGGASMPYMQRLTMSGVALHSGMVTGRPASHGCIRLPHAFAIEMFKLTKLGARVVIAANEPSPVDIAHEQLFVRKPAPAVAPEDAAREATRPIGIAAASAREFEKGSVDAKLGKVTGAYWLILEAMPVSVFVSRLEGKIFVRHGFRPLFEAPVVIRDPESLLGTHIYTAVEFKDDTNTQMRWQALSMPAESGGTSMKVSRASRSEAESSVPGASGPPATAKQALDRIEIPPEARERISQLLSPGASLIISDHGFNREMRDNGTDFIVLSR